MSGDTVVRQAADHSEVITLVAGGLIGLFTALVTVAAAAIWKWLVQPQVAIMFGSGAEHRSETETLIPAISGPPLTGPPAIFLRPKVTNIGPRFIRWVRPVARNCKVTLIGIEEYSEALDKYEPTIYVDNIALTWSCQEGDDRWMVNIYPDVPQFFDLVKFDMNTTQGPKPFYPVLKVPPLRYVNHLFTKRGTFKLTVLLTGENIQPVKKSYIFRWTGKSDDYDMYDAPPESRNLI